MSQRIHHYYELLRELVARDMRLRYKRSLLGMFWSLLNPLLQLLVFSFVFGIVLPLNIANFPLFLFVGLLAWNWLQASLLEATGAIVDNRDLVRRPGFATSILPLVSVTSNFLHLLLALPVLLVFLWQSDVAFHWVSLSLPFILGVQFLITLGIAYVVAALHVRFRDVRYLLGIILLLLFYLSPVFYDPDVIPSNYQFLYHLNPMVTLIESYRRVLMEGQAPNIWALGLLTVVGAIALWFGLRLFRQMSVDFAENL